MCSSDLAYGEVAMDNGVNFRFDEEVLNIDKIAKGFRVTTTKNKFTCKFVINTIIDNLDMFESEKSNDEKQRMTYLLVNEEFKSKFKNIVIQKPQIDKFILSIPNALGGTIIGIRNNNKLNREEILQELKPIIPNLRSEHIVNIYNQENNKTMIIDYRHKSEGYIRVKGNNYSKVTLAPAIATIVSETISQSMQENLKKNFLDKRRDFFRFRNMSDKKRNEIIKIDKRYGNIICLCNHVTEGEIVDCIRRPLGARSLDGVKKRTGAGLGCCYGAHCNSKIIKILAREMDKEVTDITKDSKKSIIWIGRIKEFKKV